MRIPALAGLCLLLAGCPSQPLRQAAANGGGQLAPTASFSFSTVAPAEYLGAAWKGAGGAEGVRSVWADASGQHALIALRGADVPALWLNRERSQMAQQIKLTYLPDYVDPQRGEAYAITDDGRLLERKLPAGEWSVKLGTDKAGKVIAVSGHPLSATLWALVEQPRTEPPAPSAPKSASVKDAGTVPPAALDKQPGTVVNNEIAEQKGVLPPEEHRLPPAPKSAPPEPRRLTALRLNGNELKQIELPSGEDAPASIAALSDGRAVAAIGGSAFLLDPDTGASHAQELYASERNVIVAADVAKPVAWVYTLPQQADDGTGRTAAIAAHGQVAAYGSDGKKLDSLDAGQVPLSQLAGDWDNRRALLAASTGVLALDFAARRASWALREGGNVPLKLLGGGAQLWVLLPEQIEGISAAKLAKLGGQLTASQALPQAQAREVRSAVEQLGWDWGSTQVSPLCAQSGCLTLFDAADPSAELAELDWSPSRHHVSRLLLARTPAKADDPLLGADETAAQQRISAVLSGLGWPKAQRDDKASSSAAGERQERYILGGGTGGSACPPQTGTAACPTGEFSLWANNGAVLMSLTAPAAPLPMTALAPKAAEDAAMAEVQKTLAASSTSAPTSAGSATTLPASETAAGPQVSTRSGWLAAGGSELLPEAEGAATPAYEVRIEERGAQCKLFRVLLDARNGNVLKVRQGSCSPLLSVK